MARPASSSRLFLRGKIFYFRMCLKSPFPEFFNKTEIRISTGTPYRSVALRFSAAMEIFMQELLARLSKGEVISNLSNIDLMRYARIYYTENIEVINVLSLHNSFDDVVVKDIVSQKQKVQNMLKCNNYEDINSQVDEFVCKHCPGIIKNSYDYLKISNALAKSMLDLSQLAESRAILDFDKEDKIISKYETVNNLNSKFNQSSNLNISENNIANIPSIKIIKLKDAIEQYLVIMEVKDKTKVKTAVDTRSRLN